MFVAACAGFVQFTMLSDRCTLLNFKTVGTKKNICPQVKLTRGKKNFQNTRVLTLRLRAYTRWTLFVPALERGNNSNQGDTRLIPKLFPGHVLGHPTFQLTSFVSLSPGTIADQWECKDLDRTTKTSDIGRKEFWYQPRIQRLAEISSASMAKV